MLSNDLHMILEKCLKGQATVQEQQQLDEWYEDFGSEQQNWSEEYSADELDKLKEESFKRLREKLD